MWIVEGGGLEDGGEVGGGGLRCFPLTEMDGVRLREAARTEGTTSPLCGLLPPPPAAMKWCFDSRDPERR